MYTYIYFGSKRYELVINTAIFFTEGILNWFDYNRADTYCAKRISIGKIHLLAIINEFPCLLSFLCSMCQLYGNQINLNTIFKKHVLYIRLTFSVSQEKYPNLNQSSSLSSCLSTALSHKTTWLVSRLGGTLLILVLEPKERLGPFPLISFQRCFLPWVIRCTVRWQSLTQEMELNDMSVFRRDVASALINIYCSWG